MYLRIVLEDKYEKIVDKILQSKKYRYIYRPTIERIVCDLVGRYPDKELEKNVKKKLHMVWGAYFVRPNFEKLGRKLKTHKSKVKTEESLRDDIFIKDLLELQTSTKERLPIYDNYYKKIYAITGVPNKIIEYGCGVNALSYPWMGEGVKYIGYDVDRELIDFMNLVFGELGIDGAQVNLGDVFEEKFERADMYLLLKVLVLFERQQKNYSLELLKKIPAKYIVVSFPTKSISGKDRGMKQNYQRMFRALIVDEPWQLSEIEFGNEIVFIVDKK